MNLKPLLIAALLFATFPVFAQTEKQESDTTGYSAIIPVSKQSLLRDVDVIMNMQYAFRNEFVDGKYTNGHFNMNQWRLEIKGKVADRVYYRLRQRYTRSIEPQSEDNMSRATDIAMIRVDVSPKVSISAGKLCADFGGIEFDLNPIDIYQYADILEQADNFLAGVGLSWRPSPKNEFNFQVLNSRTSSFQELYGQPPGITEAKTPLAYVANWRGSLFGGKIKTIWSYSYFTEAENTHMDYIALGQQYVGKKFSLAYDFQWSNEGLDRTGIVSATIPDNLYPYAVEKTFYTSHWIKADYKVSKKVNLSFVGYVDYAKWKDNLDPQKTSDDVRTAYGFIPTIEYYPFEKLNLRFFANWIGRVYQYSDYSKKRFSVSDYNTGIFQIGFVTPLLVL
jgi:Phosphate-selective porin O and P